MSVGVARETRALMESEWIMTSGTDAEIVITRRLDAPRELVFQAWTDPKQLVQWWGPQGFTSDDCRLDLRAEGAFSLKMRGPGGVVCSCHGVFREIIAPERIVYLGQPDDDHACGAGLPPRSVVTVTFVERDGQTTLTIHTRLASSADRDAAVQAGFDVGWASCLERLSECLAGVHL